jgi:hypothetical protein
VTVSPRLYGAFEQVANEQLSRAMQLLGLSYRCLTILRDRHAH